VGGLLRSLRWSFDQGRRPSTVDAPGPRFASENTRLWLDLFIVDEVGFVPFSKTDAEMLFGLLT